LRGGSDRAFRGREKSVSAERRRDFMPRKRKEKAPKGKKCRQHEKKKKKKRKAAPRVLKGKNPCKRYADAGKEVEESKERFTQPL